MGLLYTRSIALICSTNGRTQSPLYSVSRPRALSVRVSLCSPSASPAFIRFSSSYNFIIVLLFFIVSPMPTIVFSILGKCQFFFL